MQNVARQLEALGELYTLYHRLSGAGPIRREAATAAASAALGASFKARCWNLKDLGPRIVAARKKLLATGFPVPDSWLTVRTVGKLDLCRPGFGDAWAKGKKPTAKQIGLLVLTDEGADVAGLDLVCRKIEAAMLKLEAATQTTGPAGTVRRAADFIEANPGAGGKDIAKHCGIEYTSFLSHVSPKLKDLGFTPDRGCTGGFCPPKAESSQS
jgi:hypothetical protein